MCIDETLGADGARCPLQSMFLLLDGTLVACISKGSLTILEYYSQEQTCCEKGSLWTQGRAIICEH